MLEILLYKESNLDLAVGGIGPVYTSNIFNIMVGDRFINLVCISVFEKRFPFRREVSNQFADLFSL